MRLLDPSTQWVFIASSIEPRHFYDLVNAARILISRGIPSSKITFFCDYGNASSEFASMISDGYLFHSCSALSNFREHLDSSSKLVVVVSGHGNMLGISYMDSAGHQSALRTEEWIQYIRQSGKRECLIVLTQCYAGVANYADCRDKEAGQGCEFCIIGGTGLHVSISSLSSLPIYSNSGAVLLPGWVANLFMASFFRWIETPVDIDGDGSLTVLDAFRFAGASSSQELVSVRFHAFIEAQKKLPEYLEIIRNPNSSTLDSDNAASAAYRLTSLLSEPHEPWILNAHFARRIVI
jgi:hypothetical protein